LPRTTLHGDCRRIPAAGDAEVVEHGLHLVDVREVLGDEHEVEPRDVEPVLPGVRDVLAGHSYSRIVGTITQMSPLAASGRRSSILQSF